MAAAKFSVGQHVSHPACPDGTFPAGTGTIAEVCPGTPPTYKVKCDATKAVLDHEFKESDLTAC